MQNFSTNGTLFYFTIVLFLITGCSSPEKKHLPSVNDVQIVPSPTKILYKRGYFELTKSTRILLNLSFSEQEMKAENLIQMILAKTGHKLKIADKYTTTKIQNSIALEYQENNNTPPGSFELKITSNKINIIASDNTGITYASNVLISLLNKSKGQWLIPQLIIEDKPYRLQRTIILNDPTLYDSKLENALIDNRINYVLLPGGDTIKGHRDEVIIKNSKNIKSEPKKPMIVISTISSLTREVSLGHKKNIAFSIQDSSQLSEDSLKLIGQALWSNPKKARSH